MAKTPPHTTVMASCRLRIQGVHFEVGRGGGMQEFSLLSKLTAGVCPCRDSAVPDSKLCCSQLCALHAGLFVQRTVQVAELAAGFVFCRHTYLLRVPVLIGDYTGGIFQGLRNAELCCL